MADNESIGGVSIAITGDASTLASSFSAAQATAQAAGSQVAQSFNTAAAGANQFDAAIQALTTALAEQNAALALSIQRNMAMAASQRAVGAAAHDSVTEIQAVSGTLRTLDGNGGIRAAERFLTMIPGLGAALQYAFPVIGILALGEVIYRTIKRFTEMSEAEKKAAEEAARLDKEINSLKGDLDSLDTAKFGILFGHEAGEGYGAAKDAAKALSIQIHDVAMQQAVVNDLGSRMTPFGTVAQAAQIVTSPRGDSTTGKQIAEYKAAQAELEKAQLEADKARARGGNTSLQILTTSGEEYRKQVEKNAKDAAAAARKATEDLRQSDELGLAILQADHETTVTEVIRYWQARISAESSNVDRVREIQITLGHLYQESAKQVETAQNEIQRYAEGIYEANLKIQESNSQTALKFQEDSYKYAETAAKRQAEGAKGATESNPGLAQTPIDASLQQRLGGTQIGAALQIGQTVSAEQAHIAQLEHTLDLENQIHAPLAQRLDLTREILEAQIAANSQQGNGDQADKLALVNVQLQQTLAKWQQLNLGNLAQDVSKTLQNIPQALGGAIAGGVFGGGKKGEDVGTQIERALKGLGKNLLGEVFTQAIQKLIATIVIQTGLQAVFNALFPTAVTAQVIATTANTVASVANTTALGILTAALIVQTSLLGFADGGSPPVGVPSIVGERGPEIFVPKTSGSIIPNHMIKGYANGAGLSGMSVSHSSATQNNTFHVYGVTNARQMAREIPQFIKSTSPQFAPASSG